MKIPMPKTTGQARTDTSRTRDTHITSPQPTLVIATTTARNGIITTDLTLSFTQSTRPLTFALKNARLSLLKYSLRLVAFGAHTNLNRSHLSDRRAITFPGASATAELIPLRTLGMSSTPLLPTYHESLTPATTRRSTQVGQANQVNQVTQVIEHLKTYIPTIFHPALYVGLIALIYLLSMALFAHFNHRSAALSFGVTGAAHAMLAGSMVRYFSKNTAQGMIMRVCAMAFCAGTMSVVTLVLMFMSNPIDSPTNITDWVHSDEAVYFFALPVAMAWIAALFAAIGWLIC